MGADGLARRCLGRKSSRKLSATVSKTTVPETARRTRPPLCTGDRKHCETATASRRSVGLGQKVSQKKDHFVSESVELTADPSQDLCDRAEIGRRGVCKLGDISPVGRMALLSGEAKAGNGRESRVEPRRSLPNSRLSRCRRPKGRVWREASYSDVAGASSSSPTPVPDATLYAHPSTTTILARETTLL